MSSCSVCLNDYKGRVKPIQCQYCSENACGGCQQSYLLQTYEDPHCMSCKRGWSKEFMCASFTKVFLNTSLRQHRRKILFEREKALLPSLQIYVEYKKSSEEARRKMGLLYNEIGSQHSTTEENITKIAYRWQKAYNDNMNSSRLIMKMGVRILELKKIMDKEALEAAAGTGPPPLDRTKEIRSLRHERLRCKDERERTKKLLDELGPVYFEKKRVLDHETREYFRFEDLYNDRSGAVERREFIMKCGEDGCRGFLSTAYKCGVCEKRTCSQCLVVLNGENHTCKPDMVESAKAIKAETRPCPKCGMRIFKIDGCSQIWCTMEGCQTAFDWNTGNIVTGVIHNPHYYEWLRRNGATPTRETGDIPCGGLPNAWRFINAAQNVNIPNDMMMNLMEIFRNMNDITARLADYPSRMPQLINKEHDVAYLMNEMTDDEWKRQLELTETKFNRKKEIGQILQTLVTAGSEMLNRIYNSMINEETLLDLDTFVGWLLDTGIPELEQLRVFGNDAFRVLAKRDKMAVPQLEENWVWKGARALYRSVPKGGVKNKPVQ